MGFERGAPVFRHRMGWTSWTIVAVVGLVLLPMAWQVAAVWASDQPHWSNARWDSAGLAPDPAQHKEPIIQFYAARTYGWRGILGVHTWVVFKPGVDPRPACAGKRPTVIADRRGEGVDALIL